MNRTGTLNAILIGLIVVLMGVILVQGSRNNVAVAAAAGGAAISRRGGDAAVSGSGGVANGMIAVVGVYPDRNNNSVLYLIDTNREVILTYACYTKVGGFKRSNLTFLNGRLYSWDAILAQKRGFYGATEGPKPAQVRDLIKLKAGEDD